MDPLHLAHLMLLATWGGLVLAEAVIELRGRARGALREAAELHYWIDVLFEAPILLGIVATGAALAARAWPLTPLHWVKIALGSLAIAANVYCLAIVVRRRRAPDAALAKESARVRASILAAPFALAALAIGLGWFRG